MNLRNPDWMLWVGHSLDPVNPSQFPTKGYLKGLMMQYKLSHKPVKSTFPLKVIAVHAIEWEDDP